jgi:hypothetical protein
MPMLEKTTEFDAALVELIDASARRAAEGRSVRRMRRRA